MTDDPKDVRYSDIMKAIHEVANEPADSLTKPLARIKADLAADGIDVTPHVNALKMRLAKLRAAQELTQAEQRHAQITERIQGKTPFERVGEMGQRFVDGLLGGNPRLAPGYFRNLSDAGEDTKQAFAEDAELLNQLEADDELDSDERT